MKRPPAQELTYQHPDRGEVRVSRLMPSQLSSFFAQRVVQLLHRAYWPEFEGFNGHSVAPPGATQRHFDVTNTAAIDQRLAYMRSEMKGGAAYWFTDTRAQRLPGEEYQLDGLAKVSPSSSKWALGMTRPNCYIDQVAARPTYGEGGVRTRHRYGSVVLHAALIGSGFSPDARVVADAHDIPNGSGRALFDTLNFAESPAAAKPFVLNPSATDGSRIEIPSQRLEAPRLGDVVAALEQHTLWLSSACRTA